MAKLICIAGPNLGDEWELRPGVTTIGRKADNHVVLHDAKVSRRHAIIRVEGDKYTIEDQLSTNGIHIFGKRVTRAGIALETPIQIGNTTLLLTRKSLRDVSLQYVEAVGEDFFVKHKSKQAVMTEILRDLRKAKANFPTNRFTGKKGGILRRLLGWKRKPTA